MNKLSAFAVRGAFRLETAIIVAIIASITNIAAVVLSAHFAASASAQLADANAIAERNKDQLGKQQLANTEMVGRLESLKLDLARSSERFKEAEDETRIKMDLHDSKLRDASFKRDIPQIISSMRPRLTVNCSLVELTQDKGVIGCSYINKGQYLVHITATSLQLLDLDGETPLIGSFTALKLPPRNNIPPGTEGDDNFYFSHSSNLDTRGLTFKVTINAVSDSDDISLVIRQSGGFISDSEVKNRSIQEFSFKLRM